MSDRHPSCRSDAVAIRANNFALLNLSLSRSDALGVTDVHGLAISSMVKVKSDRVGAVTTVCAAMRNLVGVKPISNRLCSFVCEAVYPLSIARLFQPLLSPLAGFLRFVGALWAASLTAGRRAELGFSLRVEASAAGNADKMAGRDIIPRRHVAIMPQMFYPCKPDIFAKTYEPADDGSK